MKYGDFKYNGVPTFEVGFNDFYTISEFINNGGRLLSRNIEREDLREFYIKKGLQFAIRYEGMTINPSAL